MGGGDLNLKKSWHPSTLRNIERVWKAEQKHEVEQAKIEQLQRELADERAREDIQTYAEDQGVVKRKGEKLDWMYQGPAAMVNREEYLLGRRVDKTLETMQQMEAGKEPSTEEATEIPVTMFSSQDLSGTATVDLATKIREDPLFSIMKKEKEERKSLLTNPVKMKQLQQLLKASISSKKSKKHKKNKKKKHQESDSDSDDGQEAKLKSHLAKNTASSHRIEQSERKQKYREHENGYKHHSKSEKRRRDYESDSDHNEYKKSHKEKSQKHKDYQKHTSHRATSNCSSPSPSPKRPRNPHPDRRERQSPSQDRSSRNARQENGHRAKRMTSEERERLLREMQDNAKWRDEQRQRKTQRYREEEEREERANKGKNAAEFVKPMLTKAAGKGTLENRVKQKIFTIQRGKSDMDKNFVKRH